MFCMWGTIPYMQNTASGLDERSIRAITLLAEGKVSSERTYSGSRMVESSREGTYYLVTVGSCTCPDAKYRKTTCKHQIALRISQVLEQAGRENQDNAAF